VELISFKSLPVSRSNTFRQTFVCIPAIQDFEDSLPSTGQTHIPQE
jgi:hypothetical protein